MTPTHYSVFWSGGLDSTYIVLQTLLLEQKKLQPYYIIDPDRPSWKKELEVMQQIREEIARYDPNAAQRLLPTRIFEKKSIKKYWILRWHYHWFTRHMDLGPQYEWLARFACQHKLSAIAVGFIKNPEHLDLQLDRMIRQQAMGEGFECRIKDKPHPKALQLFKRLRFPIIWLSKHELVENAIRHGFSHLLALSWFCHTPTSENKPCGHCRPCQMVEKTGHLQKLQSKHSNKSF